MTPLWIVAFLDLPGDTHEAGAEFWSDVTGFQRGPQRGEQGQFATLVPPAGTDYLRVQRLEEDTPRGSSTPTGRNELRTTTSGP